jgi:hypothetical protein
MTQKARILKALHAAGGRGVTTNEFLADPNIGHRYAARIMELRREGHEIETTRIKGHGGARYTLVGQAQLFTEDQQGAPA